MCLGVYIIFCIFCNIIAQGNISPIEDIYKEISCVHKQPSGTFWNAKKMNFIDIKT